jgi:hypothetical protein
MTAAIIDLPVSNMGTGKISTIDRICIRCYYSVALGLPQQKELDMLTLQSQPQRLSRDQLLAELLKLHETQQAPEREFIEDNAMMFQKLFDQGLSTYQIIRMFSGRIRFKANNASVLTPKGRLAAQKI